MRRVSADTIFMSGVSVCLKHSLKFQMRHFRKSLMLWLTFISFSLARVESGGPTERSSLLPTSGSCGSPWASLWSTRTQRPCAGSSLLSAQTEAQNHCVPDSRMGCPFLPLTKNHAFLPLSFYHWEPISQYGLGSISSSKFLTWGETWSKIKSYEIVSINYYFTWRKEGRRERKKEGKREGRRRKERKKESFKKLGLELGNYSSILLPNSKYYSWWTASSSSSTGLSKVLHTLSDSIIIVTARSLIQTPPHSIISILRMQKPRVRVLKRLAQSPSPLTTKATSEILYFLCDMDGLKIISLNDFDHLFSSL